MVPAVPMKICLASTPRPTPRAADIVVDKPEPRKPRLTLAQRFSAFMHTRVV